MRRVFQGAAVLVGFVCASTSGAQEEIRLGTIESRSQAGEPVSARIPIRRFPEQALERLEVGLAPARIFDRAGIERAPELSRLDFELVAESGDSPYIAVTSEEPIDEPLLDFLVQVSWPEGDLVREYTLLLEPPSAAEEQMPRQGRAGADGGEPFREVTREGEGERRDTAYGPVEPGDTLWRIAAEHRPDGSVTVAQTMLAILRLNPQAFASDNVNELLADAELELPSRAEIERLSAAEAQATYEEHLERWVPPAERSSEAASEEAPTRDPAGRDDPPQQAPDPASAEQARLRILALGDEAAGEEVLSLLDADLENSAANVHRLQGALAALREERESLRAEREDLRERVADLSERVAALERLVDLDMQGVLPPPEAEPTPAVPLPQVNEPLDPVVDGAGSEPEPEPEEPGEAQRDDAGEEGWLTGDASATEVWVEGAAQRQVLIGLGVTLLALAGGAGWLLYRRRRRLAREDRPQAQSQRDDSLALDLGEQRPRRDALQVADEYLADNDLRRAREVLERGLHREPERPDLRRRLLEVLARLDDREEFLAQAQELHDRTPDEADPDWRAVAAIGGRYAPESPLFAGAAAGGVAAADGGEGRQEAQAAGVSEEAEEGAELDAKPDLDELDLGLAAEEPDPQAAGGEAEDKGGGEAEGGKLEDEAEAASSEAEPTPAAAVGARDQEDDFERRLDEAFDAAEAGAAEASAGEGEGAADEQTAVEPPEAPDRPAQAQGPEPAMAQEPEASAEAQDMVDELFGSEREEEEAGELDEMDLDSLLDEQGAEGGEEGDGEEPAAGPPGEEGESASATQEAGPGVGEGDEADTKLDLARAYIDLGDEAGARELLQEVMEEGTESQRESARRVLGELGEV